MVETMEDENSQEENQPIMVSDFLYNGKKICYREIGEGKLLLILPGNTSASIVHSSDLEYYKNNYLVVSLDFLGTGGSDRLEEWPENFWEEGAKQVKALIDHLDYENARIIGTSGGAVIGLLTASLYPEIIDGVVADSFTETFTSEMLENNVITERSKKTEDQINFWKYCHGPDWEDVVNADTEMITKFVNKGGKWLEGSLEKIKCPVLITVSREDSLLPDVANQMVNVSKKIYNCTLYINNSGSHPLMWSKPGIFKNISEYFLGTLGI